jgi:hypothetical protein
MGENALESPVFSKKQVEKMVDKALTKDPFVKFMVTKLRDVSRPYHNTDIISHHSLSSPDQPSPFSPSPFNTGWLLRRQ